MKQKKRVRRAIMTVLCCYGAVMLVLLGILRSTSQTRLILYGEDTVMAHCIVNQTAAGDMAYTMELGGGEWSFSLAAPLSETAADMTKHLPPCMTKLFLRLFSLAEYYTTEWIRS